MMDTSEYMPMFLAEAREHLQELNLAIVTLEENPHDRATIDEIFRFAHSMKGMSATMGFAMVAELTHEMENVFELLKERTEGLPSDAIDTLLACLDALSATFDSIEVEGQETLDKAPLIKRLHALVRAGDEPGAASVGGGAALPDLEAAAAAGERVLHVVTRLADDTLMPAVRAHMVFAKLAEYGTVIGSIPAEAQVELFDGQIVEAWLAGEGAEEVVAASVGTVSDVLAVEVGEVGPPPAAVPVPASAPGPNSAIVVPIASGRPAASADHPAGNPAAVKPAAGASRTVRVDAERLDALMHSMGELVIHRTAVEALTAKLDVAGLQQAVQELTRSSQALQSMVMQVRMIPVDVVFLRFPRLVRDLSSKLGKEVKLELVGRDTELDRTVVDAVGDPLVHLVRNSLDHGLEGKQERLAAGKPAVGRLEISARHAGGNVVIEVRDDGRGINPQAIAGKALAAGLIDAQAAEEIDLKGAVELLFAPGFSTSETTSDISGRGVGMDAVRTKIRELGGEVVVESTLGHGTLAQIKLPLTLAIVSALQVDISGGQYAIPLDRVERTLRLSQQTVSSVAGRRMLVLSDGVLQLLEGSDVFRRKPDGEHEFVVIVHAADRRLALAVDELVGQRELVTRPLPSVVSDGEPVSGGAALADGRIALIVDCDALLKAALGSGRPRTTTVPTSEAQTVPVGDELAA
jgi:two-component system chemotaxis sensor kinase CheA